MKIFISSDAAKTNPIQSQYKANSRKAKMNVGSVITKDYENKRPCRRPENKANSNPNKPNCKRKSLLIQSDFCEIIEVVRRKLCSVFIKAILTSVFDLKSVSLSKVKKIP